MKRKKRYIRASHLLRNTSHPHHHLHCLFFSSRNASSAYRLDILPIMAVVESSFATLDDALRLVMKGRVHQRSMDRIIQRGLTPRSI